MLYLSVWLTLFVAAFTIFLFWLIKKLVKKSGDYFVRQQTSLGDVDGYIEEMINGQKVVKVFCHEKKAEENFNRKNEELYHDSTEANRYANYLGPVIFGMGYVLYVLLAVIGGSMAITGVKNVGMTGIGTMTIGTIASFLTLSRAFVNPMGQVSQQINFVIMALAGAARILTLSMNRQKKIADTSRS